MPSPRSRGSDLGCANRRSHLITVGLASLGSALLFASAIQAMPVRDAARKVSCVGAHGTKKRKKKRRTVKCHKSVRPGHSVNYVQTQSVTPPPSTPPAAETLPSPSGAGLEAGEPERHEVDEACTAAEAPALPPGYGWVTGNLYIAGGPSPGIYSCGYVPVELVVTSTSSGTVVARQQVGERESWAIALPEGSYSLRAYDDGQPVECSCEPEMFSVAAGRAVTDDCAKQIR
jgi:hypothetical protein